ncbi:MAG: Uncharacterized protein G01um101429_910 [Parcubacteria group bacterium Gr01-1014_29]|nr:MAG: Uncharacterized protein G01um101429_910 [Parcubacteria group bacterium Gr01-1014_29]
MKSVLRQHKIQKRHARIRNVTMWIMFCSLLLGGGAVALLMVPQLQLEHITVLGQETISMGDVERVVHAELADRVLGLFSRGNMLLFRTSMLEARILKEFPTIASAEVSRSFTSRDVQVAVRERTLWGVYCMSGAEETSDETTPAQCYYIGTDGVLFEISPRFTGSVIFRVTDYRQGGTAYTLGSRVVEDESREKIQYMEKFLTDKLSVSVREVVLGRTYNDTIELVTNEGWYVLLDGATDVKPRANDLLLVFEKHTIDRTRLEYVDIRFEGKVFYKNK